MEQRIHFSGMRQVTAIPQAITLLLAIVQDKPIPLVTQILFLVFTQVTVIRVEFVTASLVTAQDIGIAVAKIMQPLVTRRSFQTAVATPMSLPARMPWVRIQQVARMLQ